MRLLSVAAVFAVCAPPAWAQIGTLPDRSPYRDIEFRQEWTTFAGQFNARSDPAHVAPRGGLFIGERWAIKLGGPMYFTARIAGSMQERTIVNPRLAEPARSRRSERLPILYTDMGLELQLTGSKTWRSIAPVVNGGIGMTADLKSKRDVGGFKFGQPFTLTFGAAIKYIPARGPNVRFDWSSYVYRIHYPESYFLKSGDAPIVLPASVKKDLWRRNNVLTVGLTVMNFR
ncbi:MAG: hypothetical protein MNPFHGCM_00771 [Gemmatimonadaceae bacterium]|nr:hypothetical protein [Gemmatimonadaceae bacterium]